MTVEELYLQMMMLPPDLQKEVEDFVAFLNDKEAKKNEGIGPRARLFGSLKGQIYMAPDFDEPLEEFREYME